MLFSIESVEINPSRISVLCWLNKKGLNAYKKKCQFEVKQHIKWCRAVNSILSLLLLLWAYFEYFSWRKRGTVQFHISPKFLLYAEADQHENVRQAVVCKRQGLTRVVEHTSSLFDWLLECFVTIVSGDYSLCAKSLQGCRGKFVFVFLIASIWSKISS